MSTNGWEEWGRYVLKNIEEIKVTLDEIKKAINKNRESILVLNIKAGLWGVMGGFLPVAITLFIMYIRGQ